VSTRVRVGIDARLATRGLGIAQFIFNLTEQVAAHMDVIWFGHPGAAPRCVAGVRSLAGLPYPVLESRFGRVTVERERLNLFHFTGNTGWTTPGPVPFVLTVHDVIFLDSGLRSRRLRQIGGHRYARWNLRRAVRQASSVVSVSQTSAHALTRQFPGLRVKVIPNASDVPPDTTGGSGKRDSAIVFASKDPRKGLELAYRAWVAAGRIPRQLEVLGGGGIPRRFEKEAAEDLRHGRVNLLPYLSRDQLHESIRRARVLIYPSSDEGFGLPVLEAMASGTPVIAGLASATLEVGGDAIACIDRGDAISSIAGLLQRLSIDEQWRERLIQAGLRRARHFSWSETGQQYVTLYNSIVQEHSTN
jgi:glycosyltransferase involved in cell wall biosynthesis